MNSKEKIIDIAKKQNIMALATLDASGLPKVRPVNFAIGEDGSTLYFFTFKGMAKAEEIMANNNVNVAIYPNCNSMEELLNLQFFKGSGKAFLCDTPEEIQKGFALILQKAPFLKEHPAASDPSIALVFRIELENVTLTDNTAGIGYMEQVSYK